MFSERLIGVANAPPATFFRNNINYKRAVFMGRPSGEAWIRGRRPPSSTSKAAKTYQEPPSIEHLMVVAVSGSRPTRFTS